MHHLNQGVKPAVGRAVRFTQKPRTVRSLGRRFKRVLRRLFLPLNTLLRLLMKRTFAALPLPENCTQRQAVAPQHCGAEYTGRSPAGVQMVWLAPAGKQSLRCRHRQAVETLPEEQSDIREFLQRRRSRLSIGRSIALAQFGVILSWIGALAVCYSAWCSASLFAYAWAFSTIGLSWSATLSVMALRRDTSASDIEYN